MGECKINRPSQHFIDRIKERSSIPKKATDKFIDNALLKGICLDEAAIKPKLYNYMVNVAHEGYQAIVYGRSVLIVADKGGVAVTILRLPKEYYASVDAIMRIRTNTKKKRTKRPPRDGPDLDDY